MKRVIACILALMLTLSLAACGGAKPKDPPDLTGQWKQTNSDSEDSYQTATISGNVIEVYWYTESDQTSALYWAGTFEAPATSEEPYTWESVNDKEKTAAALLASGDDTKTFTYKDGQISYSVSALGVTTTVILEKQ